MSNESEILFLFSLADSKLEKCGGQTGHDDEDLFKERLRNMGKSK